jgi:sulfur carrier protein ThiS
MPGRVPTVQRRARVVGFVPQSRHGAAPGDPDSLGVGGNTAPLAASMSDASLPVGCLFGGRPFVVLPSERYFMRVLLVNTQGSGFADYVQVPDGTTVRDLFQREIRFGKPEDYLIRVNRQPVPSDQSLQEGDRISFTPTKIEGAA